jgi:hypothetical protein
MSFASSMVAAMSPLFCDGRGLGVRPTVRLRYFFSNKGMDLHVQFTCKDSEYLRSISPDGESNIVHQGVEFELVECRPETEWSER